MRELQVLEVRSRRDIRRFADLAYRVYARDPHWVAPLRRDIMRLLDPKTNGMLTRGPYRILLAVRGGRPVARILAGIDEEANTLRKVRNGWFALFECLEDDRDAAEALVDQVVDWMRSNGIRKLLGPLSASGGDDSKGFLVRGHDTQAAYLCSHNPEWYAPFFQAHGFDQVHHLYAYYLHKDDIPMERFSRVVEYAKQRYSFRVDPLDFDHLERELEDIQKILSEAILESWEDLTPPDVSALRKEANALKRYADPDLLHIARRVPDGRPLGFALVLPNLNEALSHIRGRLHPIAILKLMYWRRRITGVRGIAQFVVPDYHKKAVMSAIFHEVFRRGIPRGYTWADASTVGEENLPSISNTESLGAKRYKEYWIMIRILEPGPESAT